MDGFEGEGVSSQDFNKYFHVCVCGTVSTKPAKVTHEAVCSTFRASQGKTRIFFNKDGEEVVDLTGEDEE